MIEKVAIVERVARRFLLAARPVPLDKGQARSLAKRIYKEMGVRLKVRPSDLDSPLKVQRSYNAWLDEFMVGVYETTDVMGRRINVPVWVGAKSMGTSQSPREFISGGAVVSGSFGGRGFSSKLKLVVRVNPDKSPSELSSKQNRNQIEREIYSVLIHEATHLRDLLRAGDATDELGPEAYYNKPIEVRAFMQQIVDEVLEHADEVGRKTEGFGLHLDSGFIDRALEKSLTWERVRHHMSTRNRQLVLKAVARALQDEWPSLQERYPVEDIDDE